MSRTKVSIHVRTILRTGNSPEGRVIRDETLTPLTADERRAGKKDTYALWVMRFGDGTSVRHKEWRDGAVVAAEPVPAVREGYGDITPESFYQQVYETMLPRAKFITQQLIGMGILKASDREDMISDFYDGCRDAAQSFDEEESDLKTFLWNVLEKKRVSFIRMATAKKRQGKLVSIDYDLTDDETAGGEERTFSEECLADPRTVQGWAFNWLWNDLEDLCDPDERWALRKLFLGYTSPVLASRLRLTLQEFRKKILGPLQVKCDFVGFCPRKKKFILH